MIDDEDQDPKMFHDNDLQCRGSEKQLEKREEGSIFITSRDCSAAAAKVLVPVRHLVLSLHIAQVAALVQMAASGSSARGQGCHVNIVCQDSEIL
jgi:hypothetical protein